MSNFVHLHTHSHFSLLDGLGKIPELIYRAKELGMEALALTDHGAMYGVIEFYEECQKQGIKPIIGVETYLAPRRMEDKEPRIDTKPYHLVLLARNETGYQNLLKLVTAAHLVGHYYRPRIDKAILKKHAEGLIALTACVFGEIPQLILKNKPEATLKMIAEYQEIFGKENFYLELQDHPELPEQRIINQGLIKLSEKTGAPLVATGDIHYIHPEDREAHEVLLAVQTGKDLDDESRITLKETNLSMRPAEELIQAFKESPEAIKNTLKIADRCQLELKFGKTILPKFPLNPGETAREILRNKIQEGLKKRFETITSVIRGRIDYELQTIEKTHFEDYFLIVADYVNFAKKNGILVGPGRGSAAGSLVSYSLNITDLNPLQYNLLFERFLNPERIAPPDIDLDFADARRGEVLHYISQKYGTQNVAQIITFGTMASRGSVRDTGRALGMSYADVDKIAKLIPFGLTLEQSLETVSELKDLYLKDSPVKKLLDMAQRLEGVARHASTHAAGLVISEEPLENYVPLQFSPRGEREIITQYPMNDLETIGLIKMDILGLANLTILENTLKIIKKTQNREIRLEKIPLDDSQTYELLARAETTGVFQLESDGMKRYLKELRPTSFEDIIAMVALYRPGPIRLIPEYIQGKHGKKITYLHPKLQPILENTYGIAVYQEQVLQIARDIAGFTLGEADVLRKAIGKKIRRLLMEQERKFMKGAIRSGISKNIAEKLFHFIEPFAEYGFNRAHAACYGLIAYQTAYLKKHFPKEFMAALLTSEQNNLDKLSVAIAEAERMKIKVLPADVNESFVDFGVVVGTSNIRFGLAAIKNVGRGAAEAIVEERILNGPYNLLESFLKRLGSKILNKKIIEALAKVGALERFGERNQILMNMEAILRFLSDSSQKVSSAQIGLFGQSKDLEQILKLEPIDPATKKQKLAWEKELLGMYVSEHPLHGFEDKLSLLASPIGQLNSGEGTRVKVAGIITSTSKILTRSREPMIFATLEDTSARTEVLVFPKVLKKDLFIWRTDNIILVEGRTNLKDGVLKIIAESAQEIILTKDEETKNQLILTLPANAKKDLLLEIKKILEKFPGETPVILKVPQNDDFKEIRTKTRVKIEKKLMEKLSKLLGGNRVEQG